MLFRTSIEKDIEIMKFIGPSNRRSFSSTGTALKIIFDGPFYLYGLL